MTVGVGVKVFDGVVLATDSATAFPLGGSGGAQVYKHANKVFQLHRSHPIGAMTWGMGSISSASIATLVKDLRRRLMGLDPDRPDWALDEQHYTIESVVDRVVDMMYDELYANAPDVSGLGFFVAGFSAGERLAEGWQVDLADASVRPTPQRIWGKDDSGWVARGSGADAVGRLIKGADSTLVVEIEPLIDPAQLAAVKAKFGAKERLFVLPAMPFEDAIDLARFLVDTAVGYSRFWPGPDLVGGSVDVAGISRHEGFKWINRKHYYPSDLNPRRPHEHDQ